MRTPVRVACALATALALAAATGARGEGIRGTVRDPDGAPVAGADFDVFALDGTKLLPDDTSDPDGTYEVLLGAGTYDVTCSPPLASGLAPRAARRLVVTGTVTLDWTLPPAVRALGRVTGPGGLPVAGGDLDFDRLDDGSRQPALGDLTGRFGTFASYLEAGEYRVTVNPPLASGLAPARLARVSLPTPDTLAFVLVPAVHLTGTVTGPAGEPVAGARLAFESATDGARVPALGNRTLADGTFDAAIAPGEYLVSVEPPRTSGLASRRIGPVGLGASGRLDVTCAAGLLVSGRVLDRAALPLAGARWSATDEGTGERVPTPDDLSDSDGRFAFVLAPGTYRLTLTPPAVSGLDTLVFHDVRVDAPLTLDASYATGRPSSGGLRLAPANDPAWREVDLMLTVPEPGPVRLEVFDVAGRRVRTLLDAASPAGVRRVHWDGRNASGSRVGTSVYLLRASQGRDRAVGRVVLLP